MQLVKRGGLSTFKNALISWCCRGWLFTLLSFSNNTITKSFLFCFCFFAVWLKYQVKTWIKTFYRLRNMERNSFLMEDSLVMDLNFIASTLPSHYLVLCLHYRSDSSFRFFVFFFVYICQFGVHVLQTIGITGWGTWWVFCAFTHSVTSMSVYWSSLTLSPFCFPSGWISALIGLNTSIPVGIIMLLIAALFTALSVGSLIMFKKVTQSQTSPACQHQSLCLIALRCAKPNVSS